MTPNPPITGHSTMVRIPKLVSLGHQIPTVWRTIPDPSEPLRGPAVRIREFPCRVHAPVTPGHLGGERSPHMYSLARHSD